MIPYNKYDKLKMAKLFIVLKILEESNCNECINIIFKKKSRSIVHKNNAIHNNSSVKKYLNNKIYTECILPMQEVDIKDDLKSTFPKKDGSKSILPINDVNIEDVSECIPLIQDVTIEDNSKPNLPIEEVNIENDSDCQSIIEEVNFKNFISTVPIIIAEKNIDIPIESTFKLKNSALDIKNMNKELYLTNSRLLPMYEKYDNSASSFSGKLFLEGFVRNKLDFSIAKGITDNIISLDTECVIIYIPFKCTTLIQYKVPPVFPKEKTLDYIPLYMSSNCADYNEYLNKKNTQYTEYNKCNTPPISCEINGYKICETYTLLDKSTFNDAFPLEINFDTIKENIIINLSLTLLQEQDVAIKYRNHNK